MSSKNSSASNSPPQASSISPETSQKKPASISSQPQADPPTDPSANDDISIIDVIPDSPTPSNPAIRQDTKSTTPIRNKSSGLFVNTTTDEEQQMVELILKSGDCKVRVSRIPVGLLPGNNQPVRVSVSASAFLAEQHRRLTKEFTQPPKTYNPLAKTTPSKPLGAGPSYTSLTGTGVKANNGFAKFLERNTPSKITRTEIDDKRKAELLAKENKEKVKKIKFDNLRFFFINLEIPAL